MAQVSTTFHKSKTNQIIEFILKKYGHEDDRQSIIDELLMTSDIHDKKSNSTLIKPTKSTKDNSQGENFQLGEKKMTKRGQSKWTAFQKWCKIFGVINGYKLDKVTTKQIWEVEGEEWQGLWQAVAVELNKGVDIRQIENKPDLEPLYRKVMNIDEEPVPVEEPVAQTKTKEELLAALAAFDTE